MNLDTDFISYIKINTKWIIYLNVKGIIIQLLGKKQEKIYSDLFGDRLSGKALKA